MAQRPSWRSNAEYDSPGTRGGTTASWTASPRPAARTPDSPTDLNALSVAPLVGQPSALAAEFVPAAASSPVASRAPVDFRFRGGTGAGGSPARRGSGPPTGSPARRDGKRGFGGHGGDRAHGPGGPPGGGGRGHPVDMYGSNRIREDARRNAMLLLSTSPNVPDIVGQYHCLNTLENPAGVSTAGHAVAYKALSSVDGEGYLLRRYPGHIRAPSDQIVRAVESWRRIRAPGIVSIREALTTDAFAGDKTKEIVFVYDYFPRAETVRNIFFHEGSTLQPGSIHPLPENTIWALLVQLLNTIHVVHSSGLALRDSLAPSALLLSGRNRVRANKVGISDAFDEEAARLYAEGDTSATIKDRLVAFQKEDLASVGRLVLALAARQHSNLVRSGVLVAGVVPVMDILQRSGSYSGELLQLSTLLLRATQPGARTTVADLLSLIAPRLALEYNNVWVHADAVEAQLVAEMDASRMLRLATLLGFVNEREGGRLEPQWAETGDNYLLKLFRDYVFHQNDEEGRPVLDYSHVLESLGRLDAGSSEEILLSSPNGAYLMPSFADMKRCLYNAIADLRRRAT